MQSVFSPQIEETYLLGEHLDIRPGEAPILFTAPHGISLKRDGWTDHKSELHTTRLAQTWASSLGGTSVAWAQRYHRVEACEGNRDPNYLTGEELQDNIWNRVLQAHAFSLRGKCLHIDVHGKQDRDAEGDCDVGLEPLRHLGSSGVCERIRDELSTALADLLTKHDPPFRLDLNPALHGLWPLPMDRWTLSMQGARRKLLARIRYCNQRCNEQSFAD